MQSCLEILIGTVSVLSYQGVKNLRRGFFFSFSLFFVLSLFLVSPCSCVVPLWCPGTFSFFFFSVFFSLKTNNLFMYSFLLMIVM